MKLWLDDDPHRDSWVDDTWTIVRTPVAALLACIESKGQCEEMSVDHDLGLKDQALYGVEPTGYTVLCELETWANQGWWDRIPQKFTIHSGNPVGRKNMQAAIDSIERMRHGNV